MNAIDFTPLYRSSIGYDRLSALLNNALSNEQVGTGFPPYNIEVIDEDQYLISLAVAGFKEKELDIQVENGVLTVEGSRADDTNERNYLYQGIAGRSFKRQFSLADYIKVVGADLEDGLLKISLVKEVPEAMKPKSIKINQSVNVIESKK